MGTQQEASTINQQDRLAAEMQLQRQMMQQRQYYLYKQQTVMQIVNALNQVDPFEVIKTISQHGVYTLQLDPQEKMYLSNLLFQLFSDPNNDFTVDNWREILNVLSAAVGYTNRMQVMYIGRPGMGNYNQFGMMGNFGNSMGMGMNMPGMGFGFNQFGQGMTGQGPGFQFKKEGDPSMNDEAAIAQFKQIFSNLIYQCDPVIFINYLLQDNYEPNLTNNDMFVNVLRQLIGNSLWKAQDNILQIFYYVTSYLYNNEYQKKMNAGGTKQQAGQQYNMMGMGGMPNMMGMGMGMNGMGGMMNGGMPNMMGMGMPGMGMNGMGGMMNGGMPNMGSPMDFGFNPMMNGGMPMGMGGMPNMMGMGMGGMMPPLNGMNMGMGMNGMGMGSGMGDFNSQFANQSPMPMW
jgi:hypothetical protein